MNDNNVCVDLVWDKTIGYICGLQLMIQNTRRTAQYLQNRS